ncbi:P-loop containing nucleoside triphosphate hydrolase protein [Xylaria acuta]|nr:P-loop containing nucleoside triphosphate hydrolase protein [Xylaria acuta]
MSHCAPNLEHWDPRDRAPVPTERGESPEFTASAFSRLTFSWMTSIMTTGHQRKLELNDIWLVNPNRSVEPLSRRFKTSFRQHVERKSKHALVFALHDTFKRDFWLGGVCLLIASITQVMVPFTLRFLLNFLSEAWDAATSKRPSLHPGPPIGIGLGLVFGILFLQVLQSVCTNQFIYRGFMVGAQARAVLVAEIIDKFLRVSNQESSATPGSLMTLMSSDTARIDQAAGLFHIIWTSPITILLTFALLLTNLSYSAIPGFGLLFFGAGGLTLALRTLVQRRKAINKTTEARVSLMQEIIRSIQRLRDIRKDEVQMIVKLQLVRNAIQSTSIMLPILGAMLSFITYATTSNTFTPARIFSSLALFNALRVSFNLLPVAVGQLADAWSAVRRLEQLLLASDHKEEIEYDLTSEYAIHADKAHFTWENHLADNSVSESMGTGDTPRSSITLASETFALRDMSFTINRGELLAVIGSVGSGKSSLLSALAGEMRKIGGSITQGVASRAYCPQDAWIQNATVKDNITFGRPWDPTFYNQVIDACCLSPDLQALAAGDQTEIGERGINLSGGQRQRVNLARAIYSNSDIILMDDPLSAVDAHVGQHIFEHGICGILREKTRILSTHQLHVLSRCDRVLWLESGTIKAVGTFHEMQSTSSEFQDMMANYAQKESQEGKRQGDESEKHIEDTVDRPIQTRPNQGLGDGALIKEEELASYLKSAGNLFFGLVPIVLLAAAQGSNALTSIWLSWWVSNRFDIPRSLIQAVLFYAYGVTISTINGRASRKMVHQAAASVITAPLSFHDSQPLGRIMNRLSRDAEVMDNQLPEALRMFLYTLAIIASIIVLLSYYFHYFLIALAPLTAGVLFAASYYKSSAGQFKRHEAILRSVMFARFGESVSGVQTIRAYGAEARTIRRLQEAIDDMDSAYFLTLSNQRWVTTRLDLVAAAVVLTVGIGVTTLRTSFNPSDSGLILSYVLSITQMMQLVIRSLAEVENSMVSTERLHEYQTGLPQEPVQTGQVREFWPERGEIEIVDIVLQYRFDLPPVLQGLSLNIQGGEKIGIVGRTGAGKTSLTAALFRLVELSRGKIVIDGLDIAEMPLRELRSRISVIPQDPTLFKGTVRSNLDPFDQHTDLELWGALHSAGIQKSPHNASDGSLIHLDDSVEEEGKNFSKGQRQLLAIARALVRDCRIVVCDEATSSVDQEADKKIQKTIMEAFTGKTVLTIAHRLDTIIGYDKVCVLEQGRVLEFDRPLDLWERNGAFRALCDRSGIRRQDFERSTSEANVCDKKFGQDT